MSCAWQDSFSGSVEDDPVGATGGQFCKGSGLDCTFRADASGVGVQHKAEH